MQPPYTPLANNDQKNDTIEHINDDHLTEVMSIARAYTDFKHIDAVTLIDIFGEGVLIGLSTPRGEETAFVPFLLKGNLEENILYLAYHAMVKLGESPVSTKKKYFDVMATKMVSPNMMRIVLKSATAFPEQHSGYAYFFSLNVLQSMPRRIRQAPERLSLLKQWLYKLFLWRVKNLSSEARLKRMLAFAKDKRYYTLRQIRKSTADVVGFDIGDVDVFIHGETPGGLWAQSLKKGDIVHSISEAAEHCDHLNQGQALLIADETALPTVAALLEHWQNPISPYIIAITHAPADQAYLPDAMMVAPEKCFRLKATNIGPTVIDLLRTLPQIDAAWGALEHLDAKAIRQYLRDERQLSNRVNRVKAYWQQK